MKPEEIANRHLLPIGGLQDSHQVEGQSIRIVIAERWASSSAGQLLASCLVNLLCRQLKLVRQVEIVAPDTDRLIHLPSGSSLGRFPACLEGLAGWTANSAIPVMTSQTANAVDCAVFIGEVQQVPSHGHSLVVVGEGWRAWVGTALHAAGIRIVPRSSNPLGPFLAAALAAGEIFKLGRGIRRGRFLSNDGFSLWSGASSQNWADLHNGPDTVGTILPPAHVVGAGAVGNALGYVIANLGLAEGYVVLVDDDRYDATNLNRCLLAGWLDLETQKVGVLERALKSAGVGAFSFPGTIKSYVTGMRTGLREDIARQVDDLVFSVVLSCVDRGAARQDVQGLHPHLLLGGSTLNLQAKSNLYSGEKGVACLGCFNPAEEDGNRIREFEVQLRKMPVQERSAFLAARGLDAISIEQYLSGARCGGLGEAALRDYATRPPAEFSAGFVSLGSGLLLASLLLRTTVFADSSHPRGDMTTLNFLNGGFADSGLGADDCCELACQRRLSGYNLKCYHDQTATKSSTVL